MAGLLDSIWGDNETKDEYGQTQRDRRQPVWAALASGLLQSGGALVAGGQRLMPSDRAQYIAQASTGLGRSLGGIPKDMREAQSELAKEKLARQEGVLKEQEGRYKEQQIKKSQYDMDEQTKWRSYAESAEFQKAMDEAKLTPAERMAAKAAAMKGDFGSVTKLTDPKRNQPVYKDGNIVYPNGDVYNPIYGWVMKNGVPNANLTGDLPPAPTPNPNPQPEPGAPAGAPFPSLVQKYPPPAGQNVDQEIANWSATKFEVPHGLPQSEFDEPRRYDALQRLPPAAAARVQAIGDYKEPAGSAQERIKDPILLAQVRAYNPNFQQNKYEFMNKQRLEYSADGVTGRSMIAQATAYNHITSMMDLYEKLGSADLPVQRQAMQEIERRFGKEATAGFDVARAAVADEVAKAFRGQGVLNESEQKEWRDKFNPTQSPTQFHATVSTALELLEGKEKALKGQWQRDTSTKMKDFLSPEAKAKAAEIRATKPGAATAGDPKKTEGPQLAEGEQNLGKVQGGWLIKKPDGSQVVRQ